jgi:hypothetical protein
MIEVQILEVGTRERPWSVSDVEVQDAAGTVRTFPLEHDWGPVAVGDNVIAWQDALNVWALASGQESPVLIAESDLLNDNELASFGTVIVWTTNLMNQPGGAMALIHAECP